MNVLYYVLYANDKNKIVNGIISVVNFNLPLVNKIDLNELLDKLSTALSPDKYINELIDKEDREGILKYLDNSKRKWAYFVPLLMFKLLRHNEPNEFYRQLFDDPRFIIRQQPSLYGVNDTMVNFIASRIPYRYLTRNTISRLGVSPILHKKYYTMLTEYFPNNLEYKEMLNSNNYNINRDVRSIIYNLVYFCKKGEFNSLEEFIEARGLQVEDEYIRDAKNVYSRDGSTIYIETFHGLVEINLGRMSNYVVDKPNTQLLLNELRKMSIHNAVQNVLLNSNDLRAIINYMDSNNVKWKYISSFITTIGFKPRYNNRYEKEALSILNNNKFYISTRDVLTNTDRMPDEIKLKLPFSMIPYVITSKTNVNVLYCLVYSLLNDIFKSNVNYWTKTYTYKTNLDNTRLITDKVNTSDYLVAIANDEGIQLNDVSFSNLLAILCADYYKLGRDLSKFTELKEYHSDIKIINMNEEYLDSKGAEKYLHDSRR